MNLAIPLWLFSDPIPPIKNKDVDYDPILMGPVKSIPPSITDFSFRNAHEPLVLLD
jgi:ubiquitin-activating enzyme E1